MNHDKCMGQNFASPDKMSTCPYLVIGQNYASERSPCYLTDIRPTRPGQRRALSTRVQWWRWVPQKSRLLLYLCPLHPVNSLLSVELQGKTENGGIFRRVGVHEKAGGQGAPHAQGFSSPHPGSFLSPLSAYLITLQVPL